MKNTLETDVVVNQLSAIYRSKRKELIDYQSKLRECEESLDNKDKHTMTLDEHERLENFRVYYKNMVSELRGFTDGFHEAREIIMSNWNKYKYIG